MDCDSNTSLLRKAEAVALSISLVGVPALALGANLQLTKVVCTPAKTWNAPSALIALVEEEQQSNREAILQNRAAIDYLLLRANHGCEDCEGLCCFDLTDNSKPVEAQP